MIYGHRKTTTLVVGLRMTGKVAPMVHDGPINGILGRIAARRNAAAKRIIKPGDR